MTAVLGSTRVSTSDQDVAGQELRLTQAGAAKVFTDVRSGHFMDRPGLQQLLAYARAETRWPWCAWTGWGARSANCWPPWSC